jgi:hypothetical protein
MNCRGGGRPRLENAPRERAAAPRDELSQGVKEFLGRQTPHRFQMDGTGHQAGDEKDPGIPR